MSLQRLALGAYEFPPLYSYAGYPGPVSDAANVWPLMVLLASATTRLTNSWVVQEWNQFFPANLMSQATEKMVCGSGDLGQSGNSAPDIDEPKLDLFFSWAG